MVNQDWITGNMSVTRLSRLKPSRGFIMTAPNPVPFAASSSFVSVLFSPTLSLSKSKFGFRTEGALACLVLFVLGF